MCKEKRFWAGILFNYIKGAGRHCIAAHRKKKMFIEVEREMARYDIIAGKIADDATNATLTAYLAGAFGTAGDKEADDFCIRQLLPNKLKDQYCLKQKPQLSV